MAAAFVTLLLGNGHRGSMLYNVVLITLGGASAVVTLAGLLSQFFTGPTLTRAQFERAMAAQAEVARSGNAGSGFCPVGADPAGVGYA